MIATWCCTLCYAGSKDCFMALAFDIGMPVWKIRPICLMACPEFRHMWE